jgi:hypothetical protein
MVNNKESSSTEVPPYYSPNTILPLPANNVTFAIEANPVPKNCPVYILSRNKKNWYMYDFRNNMSTALQSTRI